MKTPTSGSGSEEGIGEQAWGDSLSVATCKRLVPVAGRVRVKLTPVLDPAALSFPQNVLFISHFSG